MKLNHTDDSHYRDLAVKLTKTNRGGQRTGEKDQPASGIATDAGHGLSSGSTVETVSTCPDAQLVSEPYA